MAGRAGVMYAIQLHWLQAAVDLFSSVKSLKPGLGPTLAPIQWIIGAVLGVKAAVA